MFTATADQWSGWVLAKTQGWGFCPSASLVLSCILYPFFALGLGYSRSQTFQACTSVKAVVLNDEHT